MTRNVSIEGTTVEITAGLYDTSEGFRAQVAGDAFPRVHITPQGEVLTGDGTEAPSADSVGASTVGYDSGESGLSADNVQSAIDELAALIAAL